MFIELLKAIALTVEFMADHDGQVDTRDARASWASWIN